MLLVTTERGRRDHGRLCRDQIVSRRSLDANVRTVVNQSPQADVASGVHARLAMAAHRFLGMMLAGGSVPWDAAVATCGVRRQAACPRAKPNTPASQAIRLMAQDNCCRR